MLVPYEWLKTYTDPQVDVREYADRMIMSGSNLETIDTFCDDVTNVVCGQIKTLEKHPDSDHMVICMTDVGKGELLQIVTGAPNVHVGDKIPTILEGGTLPDGKNGLIKIKKSKLRGVESYGMFCSFSELGYPDKVVPVAFKDGVWILPEDTPVGVDICDYFGLHDATVDFEITPNRPDCLAMLGMARETKATFGVPMQLPETKCKEEGKGKAADYIAVEIKKPELCKRYVARVITDIKVEQSPWWMQKRLMYAGMRPINNIVDITNYVMLEYGQPLHAFDIRTVEGAKIVVDTAGEGQSFTTLDGTERKLFDDTLLINDTQKGLAIAGIMGGLNSEIEDGTNTVLIEAANFTGGPLRKSSRKLNLRTEASGRFEKGIDPNLTKDAADRVCYLIELLGAGKVVPGCVDVYPVPETAKPVKVRVSRVNKFLGIQVTADFMKQVFERLEMTVETVDGDTFMVTPPTIRQDLLIEEDFAEEVARMYGYDKMPNTLPEMNCQAVKSRRQEVREAAKDALVSMGLDEEQTYSFVSPKGLDKIRIPEGDPLRNYVKLINPLGEDTSVMRTTLLPNLLDVLGRNFTRGNQKEIFFEIGNTFTADKDDEGLPGEAYSLVLGGYGEKLNFFYFKGILEELMNKLGIPARTYVAVQDRPTFHPGRTALIQVDGTTVGVLGEFHPEVTDAYDIAGRAYGAELDFEALTRMAKTDIVYHALPKYPGSSRDIALVLDEDVQVGAVEEIIRQAAGKMLESVALFDIYRGAQVPEGKKSCAFTMMYRAEDHTLTDEEVVRVHSRVLKNLEEQLHATLREL